MKTPAFFSIKRYFRSASQWFSGTSERALDEAYSAAMRIKQIEDEHFGGNKITPNAGYGDTVSAYFQTELKKYLRIAKMRIMEFKASNLIIKTSKADTSSSSITRINPEDAAYPSEYTLNADQYTSEETSEKAIALLEKLKFVDSILAKYKVRQSTAPGTLSPTNPRDSKEISSIESKLSATDQEFQESLYESNYRATDDSTGLSKAERRPGKFVPRSIFRTINRLRQELDPNSELEENFVRDFRSSKNRTRIATRFILLLTIVPLLTQQLSRNFIFSPLVDHLNNTEKIEISEVTLNSPEIEEEILNELARFKEKLEFQKLIGQFPNVSPEEMEIELKDKAIELAKEYQWVSTDPVKNVLADSLSLVAFGFIVARGKREIAILKSFIDDLVYGLSDSAKAFIIILLTDVFVGFHSPHGWEVIVSNSLRHFGLPENHDFINMFIATFPVMLDSVFKYWIFRYLNQVSPSAVATYKNMNE
jgi:hypothetical protein